MIISRTPLRMSFVGGGSDIPAFYRMHGGAVISTTINKYVYVSINKVAVAKRYGCESLRVSQ